MHSLAARRHHADRVKARAFRRIRTNWGDRGPELSSDPRFVGKAAVTPHPCSCHGCGHARKWEGPTRREILATDGE